MSDISDIAKKNYRSQSAPLPGVYIVHGVWSGAKYHTGRPPTNRSAVDFDGKWSIGFRAERFQIVFSANINVVMSVSHARCVSETASSSSRWSYQTVATVASKFRPGPAF